MGWHHLCPWDTVNWWDDVNRPPGFREALYYEIISFLQPQSWSSSKHASRSDNLELTLALHSRCDSRTGNPFFSLNFFVSFLLLVSWVQCFSPSLSIELPRELSKASKSEFDLRHWLIIGLEKDIRMYKSSLDNADGPLGARPQSNLPKMWLQFMISTDISPSQGSQLGCYESLGNFLILHICTGTPILWFVCGVV